MKSLVFVLLCLIGYTAQSQAVYSRGASIYNVPIDNVPIALAGPDQSITLPVTSIDIFGGGTDVEGPISSFSWSQISGPNTATIIGNFAPNVTLSDLIEGSYVFELVVTDGKGLTGSDQVVVTVNKAQNIPPTVDAGSNISITLPTNSASLSASGADADGTISNYSWSQISGPSISLIGTPTSSNTSVSSLVQGTYVFQVEVTDNDGGTSTDQVVIVVNAAPSNIPPVVNAGVDQTITLPTSTTILSGIASDADGTISLYLWEQISGNTATIVTPNSSSTSISGLTQGTFTFSLTVTDNSGSTTTDLVTIVVNPIPNVPPVADAGQNVNITLPANEVGIGATGSTDSDGYIVSYLWTKLSGPSGGTIASPNSATTLVQSLQAGTYQFQVLVTDDYGATDIDVVDIVVNSAPPANIPPTSNAGANKVITLPTNTTTLNGSGTDVDGTISSYTWSKLSGPSGGTIASPSSAITAINSLVQGTYVYRLTVMDNSGDIGIDDVQIIVNSAPNVPPTANAGSNIVITSPTSTVTLSGSGADTDGTISSYFWSKTSGPSVIITSPNSASTGLTSLVVGTYTFTLAVTDNSGATTTDNVQVVVNPAPNIAPTVDAGTNIVITLPTNSTTLTATANDVDGTISTISWSGAGGTITSPSTLSTGVTGLTQGVYQFTVIVTDDDGATAQDIVQVTVNGAANIPPTANAGIDLVITLPTNQVTLNGSGSDVDGTISSVQWTRVSGPNTASILTPASLTTSIVFSEEGTYQFQLKVTDNSGSSAFDAMQVIVSAAAVSNGKFSYTITGTIPQHVSIAVFENNVDSALVRTIVSDTIMSPGTYQGVWNGRDDRDNIIVNPQAKYSIIVLQNDLKFNWDGTIGNNSDNMTGEQKYRGYYHCMRGLVFAGTTGYYFTGYAEGSSSLGKFDISSPRTKTTLLQNATNGQTGDVKFVATDGTYVYWALGDAYANANSFVFATKTLDDSEVQFTAGTPYVVTNGKTYNWAISKVNSPSTGVTGLAVQKTGNYLFVARAGANQLQVLDKLTGALIQTYTFTTPGSLSIDASDNLWMITGTNNIARYPISGLGVVGSPNLTISTTSEPIAMQVSTDGTKLAVADAAPTVQQLKFFSTTTGSSTGTLGTLGGYTTDATVTDTKFYFNDTRVSQIRDKSSFIAYQSDGSYWVGDVGNFRAQHFSSSNTYIDRIQSLGSTYRTWVDKNNITRLFSDYLEFEIDYSQPLTGSTGWRLKKNWGANVKHKTETGGTLYDFGMNSPITLSNGRTYAWFRIFNSTNLELGELVEGGTIVFKGVIRTPLGTIIAKDGSLQTYSKGGVGGQGVFKRFPQSGYLSGNPVWNTTPSSITTTPVMTMDDAEFSPLSTETISSSGKLIFFNPSSYQTFVKNGSPLNVPYPGYHLQSMRIGGNRWLGKTEWSTHIRYLGEYPGAGFFDIGNGVNLFAGGNVNVLNRFVLTSYHGEFWKAMQTNKFNLYWDNLLAIGQFGKTRPEIGGLGVHAAAGMAGNALTPVLVESITGDTMFVFHGDESDHSGIHRWSITNLSSIKQSNIVIGFPFGFVPDPLPFTPLMDGLPFDDTLANNTAGWTRSAIEDYTNQYNNYYNIKTSVLTYNRRFPTDIQVKFVSTATKTNNLIRDLGTNNVTNEWKITGKLAYPSNIPNGTVAQNINSNLYLDVLDDAGKILTRFFVVRNAGALPFSNSIKGNTVTIGQGLESSIRTLMGKTQPFEVEIAAGVVTFKYANYAPISTTIFDPTGDWKKPKQLRVTFISTAYPNVLTKIIDLQDLRFYKDVVSNSFTIESFGGVGDGVTDNYSAFNAASAYAEAHPNTTILFGTTSAKHYYINQYRKIKNDPINHIYWRNCQNLKLIGTVGTKVSVKGDFFRSLDYVTPTTNAKKSYVGGISPFYFYYCTNLEVDNIEANGNVQLTTRAPGVDDNNPSVTESDNIMFRFEKCDNVVMTNVYAHHAESDGILISGDRINNVWINSTGFVFNNVISLNNGRNGMSAGGLSGGVFNDCQFASSGFTGGTYGHNDPSAGVDIEPGPFHFCQDITFNNTDFSGNYGNNFITSYPSTTANVTLNNCTINVTETTKPQGITMLATNSTITGCTFNLGSRQMKFVSNSDSGATTTFTNNTITGTKNVINSDLGHTTDTLRMSNNSFSYNEPAMTVNFIDLGTTNAYWQNNDVFIKKSAIQSKVGSHIKINNAKISSGNIYHSEDVLVNPTVDYTGTLIISDP